MKNMFSIIKQQNKECYPLERICLKEYMIYEVKVTTVNNFKLYHGTCEEGYENEMNRTIAKYVRKYLRVQRPINVTQGVTTQQN